MLHRELSTHTCSLHIHFDLISSLAKSTSAKDRRKKSSTAAAEDVPGSLRGPPKKEHQPLAPKTDSVPGAQVCRFWGEYSCIDSYIGHAL